MQQPPVHSASHDVSSFQSAPVERIQIGGNDLAKRSRKEDKRRQQVESMLHRQRSRFQGEEGWTTKYFDCL